MKSLLFTLLVAFAISNTYGQVKVISSKVSIVIDDNPVKGLDHDEYTYSRKSSLLLKGVGNGF